MENVTVINPVFNNTAWLIDADSSDITLIDSSFTGFRRSEIWWNEDIYISNCSFNMTGMMLFEATNNLTITDSSFDLYTNASTTFFNIRFSDRCRVYNSSFSLPASTAARLGAWLTAVDFFRSNDIVFAENDVRNAGKVFVANGCTDVVVRDNVMANDEYVNSELQITGGSKNVLISNNTMWNLHDSIEIYDHENITIVGNHVTTDVLGFYIKPSNTSAPTEVYILNNTQIGGSVSTQITNGLVIDGNTFIDTIPIHIRNGTNTVFTGNVLHNSTILNADSVNTTINKNTVFTEPEQEWLRNWGESSTIMGSNLVHIVESDNPEITNIQLNPKNPLDNETITIKAEVKDDTGIQNVWLQYHVNQTSWETIEMQQVSGDIYEATIGPYHNATEIMFKISAKDTSYNQNIGENDNNEKYYKLQVYVGKPKPEPAPTPEPDLEPIPNNQEEIPGFLPEFLVLGITFWLILLWIREK